MKRALLIAGLLAACNTLPPQVLPPPFGPLHAEPTHLFFPSGLAVTSDGAVLVANGNFNHAYDVGTAVGLRPAYVAGFFNGAQAARVANHDPLCAPGLPPDCQLDGDESAVIIGNYAGPLALNDAGTLAFTGSRDTGILNAVAVGPGGALSCPPEVSSDPTDCRAGLVNLETAVVQGTTNTANIDAPFSIVPGDFLPPGQAAHRALYVSSVVPHIDSVASGIITTSSQVAALDMADPTKVLFTFQVSSSLPPSNGWAPGPMVFDSVRRRLWLMGCYERFASTGAGEPGTAKCSGVASNLLREIDVDAQSAANVQIFEMYNDVLSIETTQLMLADPDPVTQAPTTLWAIMRNPDSLVQITLPTSYAVQPRVRDVVPMPITPADMVRIPRTGASDLLVITPEKSGATVVYEVGQGVVAEVEGLGDSPYRLTQVPCPDAPAGPGSASACLAVAIFGECRVAFIEVPLAQPGSAVLRGWAGGCL